MQTEPVQIDLNNATCSPQPLPGYYLHRFGPVFIHSQAEPPKPKMQVVQKSRVSPEFLRGRNKILSKLWGK